MMIGGTAWTSVMWYLTMVERNVGIVKVGRITTSAFWTIGYTCSFMTPVTIV